MENMEIHLTGHATNVRTNGVWPVQDLLTKNVSHVNLGISKNLGLINVYSVLMEHTEIQLLINVSLVMLSVLCVLVKTGLNVPNVLMDFILTKILLTQTVVLIIAIQIGLATIYLQILFVLVPVIHLKIHVSLVTALVYFVTMLYSLVVLPV